MGVDYTGNFGFGVRVIRKEFDEDSEWHEDFLGYLDDTLPDDMDYFEVGEGNYTGDENDVYVCIKEPFDENYNALVKAKHLIDFLNENEIEYDGKPDIVGGLNVW